MKRFLIAGLLAAGLSLTALSEQKASAGQGEINYGATLRWGCNAGCGGHIGLNFYCNWNINNEGGGYGGGYGDGYCFAGNPAHYYGAPNYYGAPAYAPPALPAPTPTPAPTPAPGSAVKQTGYFYYPAAYGSTYGYAAQASFYGR
jgi:hypothetical protein